MPFDQDRRPDREPDRGEVEALTRSITRRCMAQLLSDPAFVLKLQDTVQRIVLDMIERRS